VTEVIRLKKNDTQPAIEAALEYEDGTPIDLTGASVRFIMAKTDGTVVVNANATIVDATAGKVRYEWQQGDLSEEGRYNAEFEVTFPNGDVLTAPSQGYFIIEVQRDLA